MVATLIKRTEKVFFITTLLTALVIIAQGSTNFLGHELFSLTKEHLNITKTDNDPELIGPDRLCVVFGSVIGDFFGGGDSDTDLYYWKIFGPAGQLLFNRSGGGRFQTISYTFSLTGTHRIELEVWRGGIPIYTDQKNIDLIQGPEIVLRPRYGVCGGQSLEIQAISPSSPNFSDYLFEWKNEAGEVLSTANTLEVTEIGAYSVEFYFKNNAGLAECTAVLNTRVQSNSLFTVTASQPNACPDQQVTYKTDPEITGEWFYRKAGSAERIFLGVGSDLLVSPGHQLDGPGNYEIILATSTENNLACSAESITTLTYSQQPEFQFVEAAGSTGCMLADGGLKIKALTPLDQLFIEGEEIFSSDIAAGETIELTGLKSGAYSIIGVLGNCSNSIASMVPLIDPPLQLEYEITDIESEVCTDTGKTLGSFMVRFSNNNLEGSYRILNEKGTTIQNQVVNDQSAFKVSIPGGTYYFEVYDLDSCRLPNTEEILVPGLNQVGFQVPSNLSVCQSFDLYPESNQNLEFTLTLPDGTQEIKASSEPFTLTLAGDYTIVGRLPGQSEICPASKEFTIDLVDPVEFEPVLIKQDCFGNRTFTAELYGRDPETVTFTWYNEEDKVVGNGMFLFPTSIGLFKLDVQPANSTSCPIPPKEFMIEEPVLQVDVSLLSTKLCELGPGAILSLETTHSNEVTDIVWRKYDETGLITPLPQFNDMSEIRVEEAGIYEASVFSIVPEIGKDCELGRNSIRVDVTMDRVDFSIPDRLSICETYEVIPETSQSLEFVLTHPDGTEISQAAQTAFVINQEGTYLLYGYHPDPAFPFCPEEKTFEVVVNRKITFEPILVLETCEGEKTFEARLTGTLPEDAVFFWYDPLGNIIGNTPYLILDSGDSGIYELDVHPLGSLPCDQEPKSFEVSLPIFDVQVVLTTEPFCPDAPSASIRVTSDFDSFSVLEWWFTDLDGVSQQLLGETDKIEIIGFNEGTYEARAINRFGCLLGYDRVLLLRSTDTIRPEVKEIYQVCPNLEISERIDPGTFAAYEWYHEGLLVSNDPVFKPLLIGEFDLVVYSDEGCAYQTSFVTEEECELRLVYPSAIQPGNPAKPFLVYTNYLIDEIEVLLFNKWGQLIFKCYSTDLITESSTCAWDGYYRGEKIPNGSYALRINYANFEKGISESRLGYLLVID